MVFGLIFRLISVTASALAYIALVILLYLFRYIQLNDAIYLGCAFVLSTLVIFILRILIPVKRKNVNSFNSNILHKLSRGKRNKLNEILLALDKRRFASGHVARVAIFAYFAYFVFGYVEYSLIIVVWALLVGTSRVLLEKHNFLDVLVGFAIGLLSAYACLTYILL